MGLRTLLPSSSLILLLLLVRLIVLRTVSLQPLLKMCPTTFGNYTPNSTYHRNLMRLLSSLTANGPDRGYYSGKVGDVPDTVYGAILCRGDLDAGPCRSCLLAAAQVVVQECQYIKDAVIWYDYCLLRYTDTWNFQSVSPREGDFILNPEFGNVTAADLPLFNGQLGKLMSSLATYAASNSPRRMFAAGTAAFNVAAGTAEIYGLVQCTTDQQTETCEECLTALIRMIPQFISGRRGASILSPTCYFRYGLHPFPNISYMVRIPLPISTSAPSPAPDVLRPPSHPTSKGSRLLTAKWLSFIISVGVVLGLVSFTGIIICMMKARKKTQCTGKVSHISSKLFDLRTLREATDGFSNSNKLGEGGFGAVYRGILDDGQAVAVKKLSRSSGQGVEVMNEVKLLAKQEHRNLVRLLGVCLEGEKLLVYEYMPNSSLDKFLFDPRKNKELIWQLRYRIIEGIARGLLYLHEESQYTVIHRDLKAGNILLDSKMNPKISDFGISRLFSGSQTHEDTCHLAGTFGYMAPEYVFNGQFSKKSDVFSFGVLVLEIVTGQKSTSVSSSADFRTLLSRVWEHWTVGDVQGLIDPSLGGLYHELEVIKCIHVGLLCVQEAPARRPAMSSVVLMLDGLSMIVDVPLQPAFFPRQAEVDYSMHSPNGLSITTLHPR